MKLVIDHLTSITDWVINTPSTIEVITEKRYIAGLNDSSLMITFDEDDTTRTATKTFTTPFDVTNYENLIFSLYSFNKGDSKLYIKSTDFAYKIDLDGVKEFYVPFFDFFTDITIGIEDITEINQIKITPLHADTDTIIISEMIAEKEELPYDILFETKIAIDYYIQNEVNDGILIGTMTASPGDGEITINNPDYLERYGVIKIDDTINSEIHQVENNNANVFTINDNFDGNQIVNTFTNANCYLQFPSYVNPGQYEVRLPGISIWGINPEPILRGGKLDTEREGFLVGGGSKERREGQIYKYTILIDCEARSQELIDIMSLAVRKLIAGESLWINGRNHDIYFTDPPVELKPTEGIDYFPKIQYSFDVEVKENINNRIDVPDTTTIDIVVTPQ